LKTSKFKISKLENLATMEPELHMAALVSMLEINHVVSVAREYVLVFMSVV
jgi:hypothetical protein